MKESGTKNANNELRANKEVMIEEVKKDGYLLKHASKELRNG